MATAEDHLAKAERFLATARLAMGDGDADSGASRAQYAIHHAMIALLLHHGAAETIAEASKPKIQADFARLSSPRYPDLARLRHIRGSRSLQQSLQDVAEIRDEADYHVPGVSRQVAQQALQFARSLVDLVKDAIK